MISDEMTLGSTSTPSVGAYIHYTSRQFQSQFGIPSNITS